MIWMDFLAIHVASHKIMHRTTRHAWHLHRTCLHKSLSTWSMLPRLRAARVHILPSNARAVGKREHLIDNPSANLANPVTPSRRTHLHTIEICCAQISILIFISQHLKCVGLPSSSKQHIHSHTHTFLSHMALWTPGLAICTRNYHMKWFVAHLCAFCHLNGSTHII